jgi:uncharacterized Zn-finger protein
MGVQMAEFEIVVPNSADRYDEFLELFDRRIKISSLKRVARLGRASWDFSGGFLSKGSLQVYLRGNDICCRVSTEIEAFLIVIVMILNLLIGLIFLVVALGNQKKIEREIRIAVESATTQILISAPKKPVKIPVVEEEKTMDCPSCGKALPEDAKFCPHCGFQLKCMVCNLPLGRDKIIRCPYCSSLAHRDHLLEYIKVKGKCPSCGKKLKKDELV